MSFDPMHSVLGDAKPLKKMNMDARPLSTKPRSLVICSKNLSGTDIGRCTQSICLCSNGNTGQ